MAKSAKTRWTIAGSMMLLGIVLIMLWASGLVSVYVLSGCVWIITGVSMLSSRMFGSLPRWPYLMLGLGTSLMGAGWVFMGVGYTTFAAATVIPGSLIGVVRLFALAIYSQRPHSNLPLVLADRARAKAGLPDATDDQGPALQVVLVDPGPHPNKVGGRLIWLYDIAGTPQLKSILHEVPTVLQTTTSRREADFVAARLAECGAHVDIVRASDQASPGMRIQCPMRRARAGSSCRG